MQNKFRWFWLWCGIHTATAAVTCLLWMQGACGPPLWSVTAHSAGTERCALSNSKGRAFNVLLFHPARRPQQIYLYFGFHSAFLCIVLVHGIHCTGRGFIQNQTQGLPCARSASAVLPWPKRVFWAVFTGMNAHTLSLPWKFSTDAAKLWLFLFKKSYQVSAPYRL